MQTITYRNHVIEIGEETAWRFLARGPLVNTWKDDYLAATTAIDAAIKAHEAQTRCKIAVQVLDGKGNPQTVRGIHAGNGSILWSGDDEAVFYPALQWVQDCLREIHRLHTTMKALQSDVASLRITRHSIEAGRSSSHDVVVDKLLAVIEQRMADARRRDPLAQSGNVQQPTK